MGPDGVRRVVSVERFYCSSIKVKKLKFSQDNVLPVACCHFGCSLTPSGISHDIYSNLPTTFLNIMSCVEPAITGT